MSRAPISSHYDFVSLFSIYKSGLDPTIVAINSDLLYDQTVQERYGDIDGDELLEQLKIDLLQYIESKPASNLMDLMRRKMDEIAKCPVHPRPIVS